LPYIINKLSKPILYADDTSILCFKSNSIELATALKIILDKINEWFSDNSLTLNLNKTKCVHILSELYKTTNINIKYGDTQIHNIHNIHNIKFLGLITDSTLNMERSY
jgi:hypothetical protein